MDYRGYTLKVDLVYTEFGQSICWIKQSGLTVHKVTGWTADEAIAAGKRWVDYRKSTLSTPDPSDGMSR